MDFYIVDSSSNRLDASTLDKIAGALQVQLNRDLAPIWGGNYRVLTGDIANATAYDTVCSLVDALPSDPNAVAFHTVGGNLLPTIFLAKDKTTGVMGGAFSISHALSHELCEAAGDPACNRWVDDGQGNEFALELCDAVESNFYLLDGVAVSDFVFPSFFGTGLSPYSLMASRGYGGAEPTGHFRTAAGGYQLRRTGAGGATAVDGIVRAERLDKRRHWSSRTHRRGARL